MSSSEQKIPPKQVLESMLARDYYSKWLGIVVSDIELGYCKLHFIVRKEMLNGFGSIHGGILFSAADSAFAFACNSDGYITVALDATISFAQPAFEGEKLVVIAKKMHMGNRAGFYHVEVSNERSELIALFKGTAYRTSHLHEVSE